MSFTLLYADLQRELDIDLQQDIQLLEMLKSNPTLDQSTAQDGVLYFQYRAKYVLKNKLDLVNLINRTRNGVMFEDIKTAYDGVDGTSDFALYDADIDIDTDKVIDMD